MQQIWLTQQTALSPAVNELRVHQDTIPPATPDFQFDFNHYYNQVMQVALTADSEELLAWLKAHLPAPLTKASNDMQSQAFRQQLAATFIRLWQKYYPAIAPHCFDTLVSFFEFNHDNSTLHKLRNELANIWHTQQINSFDFNTFYNDLLEVANNQTTDQLIVWLNNQPDLWSLEIKQMTGQQLITTLYEEVPALSAHDFRIIVDFFDIIQVDTSLTTMESLDALTASMHDHWLYDQQNPAHPLNNSYNRFFAADFFTQLQKSFSYKNSLLASFPPWRARKWGKSLLTFFNQGGQLPDNLDPKQVNFWCDFTSAKKMTPSKVINLSYWLILLQLVWLLLSAIAIPLDEAKFVASNIESSLFTLGFINLALVLLWYALWLQMDFSTIQHPFWRYLSKAFIGILFICSILLTFFEQSHWAIALEVLAIASTIYHYYYVPKTPVITEQLLTQLQQPFSLTQVLLASFPPWRARYWSKALQLNKKQLYLEQFDQRQLHYWFDITKPEDSRFPRLIVWSYWALITPLCLSLMISLYRFIGSSAINFQLILQATLHTAFILYIISLLLTLLCWYIFWLTKPYSFF